ncbi:MAG: HTH-type transcriptional repressor KstR2 [Syntrophorhabdus sp. PtaU1.Bin058]|nr:MAG: HTH-type transcriptional repressor KstR2 [Syntrophorhabdus sp. PtaU1.Bin058]
MSPKKGINFNKADTKQIKRINAIAKVSAQLFADKGYLETSMDDIAAAAKVTKGGIYHYFGSKTDILYFICSTYVDLDLENLEYSLSTIETTAEKIKFIIFRHIGHYATHVYAAKTLLNEAYNLPLKYFKEVKAREKRYFGIVSGVLSQSHAARGRKDIVTAMAFSLFAMVNWIYSWYNPKGSMKPEELSQLVYDIFMGGINNPVLTTKNIVSADGISLKTGPRKEAKGRR